MDSGNYSISAMINPIIHVAVQLYTKISDQSIKKEKAETKVYRNEFMIKDHHRHQGN